MKVDKIGYYRGKPISEMSREELLDFAEYAGKRVQELEVVEKETQDYRIEKEVSAVLNPHKS